MNFKNTDFIGVYENALSKQDCKAFIEYFELSHKNNITYTRQNSENVSKLKKNDVSMDFSFFLNYIEPNLFKKFNDAFWNIGYKDYVSEFSVLDQYPTHKIYNMKIQRTEPRGGYHIWHSENCDLDAMRRLLVFTLYLNDVKEGGETEFLYLSRRVKPKAGTLTIFPSGFTHTHRGNPPLSNTKYIITGWVEM